ncbi:MAG: helix-turn-helix domain-containing protein [Candidatus Eisenbacteria bacterium]|nr:helix-turn-helix domain-containing protein [Candidatus Eisenbacteria bacterium]
MARRTDNLNRWEAEDEEPLLTVADVAAWLRLKTSTVYAWAAAGKLPSVRMGNRIRFLRSDLLRWIEARKVD